MATSAPHPSKADATRALAELNKSHETAAWRRAAGRIVHNDPTYGAVNAHLIVCGYDSSAFRSGAVAYLTEMAKSGNHVAAMIAASKIAGISAPAEDRGPVDKLADRARERRAERTADNKPTRRAKLMAFLTQPR